MLRVVLVDDEAPARRYLRRMLESLEGPQVVGEADCMHSAIEIVNRQKPDAIFLDIELTRGTSFDVLSALECQPCIVFVTAYGLYATRAFEVGAVDYLLKPVGPDRLRQAVQRLYTRLNRPWGDASFLTVRNQGHSQLIRTDTLAALVAQRDYVKLHAPQGETFLMYTTLKGLLPQLGTLPFVQVSRSVVINMEQVGRVGSEGGLAAQVEFLNAALPVQLGRTAYVRLREALDERSRAA
ncbi:LytR/AlgR family response regulator transcription factor [Bordetella petrii]|uniref:LytR/AlgR family response regulator transcription factor n=1 Tax=Bordetella petrii TaxID=94624 RepID=UPI00047A3819|nr:LytTR family DNA-binding domain-containing protein [Bordetella petrii]